MDKRLTGSSEILARIAEEIDVKDLELMKLEFQKVFSILPSTTEIRDIEKILLFNNILGDTLASHKMKQLRIMQEINKKLP